VFSLTGSSVAGTEAGSGVGTLFISRILDSRLAKIMSDARPPMVASTLSVLNAPNSLILGVRPTVLSQRPEQDEPSML